MLTVYTRQLPSLRDAAGGRRLAAVHFSLKKKNRVGRAPPQECEVIVEEILGRPL